MPRETTYNCNDITDDIVYTYVEKQREATYLCNDITYDIVYMYIC